MADPDLIIHINGWPGCGKLTIGRELAKRLGAPLTSPDARPCRQGRQCQDVIIPSIEGWPRMIDDSTIVTDDRAPQTRGCKVTDRTRQSPPTPFLLARRRMPHRTIDNHLAPNWRCTAQNSACFESKRSEIAFDRNMAWVDCRRRKPLVALHSNRIPHASASCRRRERELVRGVRRRQWKYSSSSSSTG